MANRKGRSPAMSNAALDRPPRLHAGASSGNPGQVSLGHGRPAFTRAGTMNCDPRDFGETLPKDIRSDIRTEMRSIGQSIQQAIVTEIRALVQQIPQPPGRPPKFTGMEFPCSEEALISPNAQKRKFDVARSSTIRDPATFAAPEFPHPIGGCSKLGSGFAPIHGEKAIGNSSPWEGNCTSMIGDLAIKQKGFANKSKTKRKERLPLKLEMREKNTSSMDTLRHVRLPEKPPPMLDLNVPPEPPELDSSGGTGGSAACEDFALRKLSKERRRTSTHSPKFDISGIEELAENLSDGTEATICSSQGASLCDVARSRERSGPALRVQSANRLSISRELAKKNLQRTQSTKPLWRMSVREMLNSSRFDNVVGCVIILNAMTIGVQTDYNATRKSDQAPPGFDILEKIFAVWFTSELALRLWVHRLGFFKPFREGWLWNWFDFTVVWAQLLEIIVYTLAQSSSIDVGKFRLLRVLRILRLVRILRVVRVLHLISELRTIVSSIVGSFKSLGWTCVLLLLMIYIVAVYFTQSVTDHLIERMQTLRNEDTQLDQGALLEKLSLGEKHLSQYFASLSRGVLSLFQAMSGGVDWDAMAGPLWTEVGVGHGMCFAAYIAFALLALMNVVTGVFVQTALQSARNEEDAFMTDQIVTLFNMSEKQEMTISMEEIELSLSDPKSAKEWTSIGVGEADARYLFRLLDVEGRGKVPFQEFLGGALRLNGGAKAIDLLTVMQESRRANDQIFAALDALHQDVAQSRDVAAHCRESRRCVPSSGTIEELHVAVEHLLQLGDHSTRELGRVRHIESVLVDIRQSLVKLQSIESFLADIHSQPVAFYDQDSVV